MSWNNESGYDGRKEEKGGYGNAYKKHDGTPKKKERWEEVGVAWFPKVQSHGDKYKGYTIASGKMDARFMMGICQQALALGCAEIRFLIQHKERDGQGSPPPVKIILPPDCFKD